MSIFHMECKVRGRSDGGNAVAASAYRSGELLTCELTGQEFDYRPRSGVVHTEIILPDNAPKWAADRQTLWNAVHKVENRSNSQLFREFEVSLPHELDPAACKQLACDFAKHLASMGMTVDVAIHDPGERSDKRNKHAHLMTTLRRFDENGDWSRKKAREWNDYGKEPVVLNSLREKWAELVNDALKAASIDERVSHKSLADQRADALASGDDILAAVLDRLPEPHLGPQIHAMEVKQKAACEELGIRYEPVTELGRQRHEAVEHRSLLNRLADKLRSAVDAVHTATESLTNLARGIFEMPTKKDANEGSIFDLPSKPDSDFEPG